MIFSCNFKTKGHHKISHYFTMPKVKKMGDGFFDDVKSVGKKLGREALDVAVPIAKEYAKKMIKDAIKKKMGDGLYAANVGRGFRMKMSPAQVRTIKKGGAIQLNRDMLDEAGRFAMELKPEAMLMLEKALSRSKGLRLTRDHMLDLMDMKKGGSILTEVGKIVAPMVAEKLMEMGLSKVGGDILEEKFSINDVGRTGKRLFGMGKPFSKKQLTRIILDKNKVISDLEQTAYGKGLFAGGGLSEDTVIQTGSMAMKPYKETSNPYY